MRTLVQRVLRASVRVGSETTGAVERGLLAFVGVEAGDTEADADLTARRVAALRCFPGRTPMDRSVLDVGGGVLVVSQFTLAADLTRGHRPGFEGAERPPRAQALYERVIAGLEAAGLCVGRGRFGADMQVELVNDGPVTFLLEVRGGRVEPA